MTEQGELSRRTTLRLAALGVSGIVAGCSGSNGDEQPDGSSGDSPGSSEPEWPLFRGDRYNTGHIEDGPPVTEDHVRWRYETGADVWGSPVIGTGTVYVPSYDGYLYALDIESGNREWRFEIGDIADASPGVADGRVVVGSFDGHIYAVDAETGEEDWRYDAGGIVRSSPTIVDGTVYIGAHCHTIECASLSEREPMGEVLALAHETGEQRWRFETTREVIPTPAVADDTVYVGSSTGTLYALDRATGDQHWSYPAEYRLYASPALVDGSLYLGDFQGNLHCVDAGSGEAVWTRETDSRVFTSSPAVDGEQIYIGGIGVSDGQAGILAYDRSGEYAWTGAVDTQEIGSSPLVIGNHVYVGAHHPPDMGSSGSGGLSAFTTDGGAVWTHTVEGFGVGSSPAFGDGTLIFGTASGSIVAISSP